MADNSELIEELVAIKRLLIFALLQQQEVTQGQIATVLGVSQQQVSRLVSGRAK
jgi:predicted XRE-type DNA-binding protein